MYLFIRSYHFYESDCMHHLSVWGDLCTSRPWVLVSKSTFYVEGECWLESQMRYQTSSLGEAVQRPNFVVEILLST